VRKGAVAVVPAQALPAWSPERAAPATRDGSPDAAGTLSALRAYSTNPSIALLALQALAETQPSLGPTAQLVSRLACARLAGNAPSAPGTAVTPLSKTPGDASEVAAGLRKTIESSGLFYESHLADWIDGKRTNAGLQREPQARLAADGVSAVTYALSGPADAGRLAPQAEGLVQRQLQVLEHRAVYWQGDAWPGQAAEVRIAEDQGSAPDRDPTGRHPWRASLRVSLQGLGDVEASIGLTGTKARLALRTGDPASARALMDGRADLGRALDERGLTLVDLEIERDTARDSR